MEGHISVGYSIAQKLEEVYNFLKRAKIGLRNSRKRRKSLL